MAKNVNLSQYDFYFFEANGFIFKQWIDHCGNAVASKKVSKKEAVDFKKNESCNQ